MRVPDRSEPAPQDQEPLQSVLDWLDRHVESFTPYESPWGHQLLAGMLEELRTAAANDSLQLAWTAHGLDRDDVGPVIVLLSPEGAVLASAARGVGRLSRRRPA